MDDAVGIAFTAGLPYVGLRDHDPDPQLLAGFPPGWLAARTVLPLAFADDVLTLASPDPEPDLTGLDPDLAVAVVIAPRAEIMEALGVEKPRATLPEPDRDALAAVPEHLQRRRRVVPVALHDDTLRLAHADPLDAAALTELHHAAAPRTIELLTVDGDALDDRLLAAHGVRWVAAIQRGLPTTAATAPARATTAPPPTTTLLLPLAGGVGAAVQAATTLAALDHPPDRLEVLLLVPADDAAGARAARTSGHRTIVAPATLPAHRLALLDLGLLLARGDHVAVLDPGDIPAPHLLRDADAALAADGVAAARARPPADDHDPPPRRRALRRAAPTRLPTTGVVVRRDVLDALGGWADLTAKLHTAHLRVATLGDAVAGAAERS